MPFKNFLFTAVVLAAVGFAAITQAAEEVKPLGKTEVEKIVHDYIMENPQVILTAVDAHQKKSRQARQLSAMDKNKEFLFKDSSDPEAGNPKGDITVVEFFDYNCHYCKQAFADLQELMNKDKNVRVVFKEFPILGPSSETAARWALAAQKQKKYFEFHKALMSTKTPIDDALLEKIAADVGMAVDKAKRDVASSEILLQVGKNRTLAFELGLNGTPAFVIGEEIIPGGIPLSEMERKIYGQRKKAPEKK